MLSVFSARAVHKVRHAIFGQFLPPSPTLSHILEPPRFVSRPSTKIRTKAPCANSLSIVCGVFVREGCLSDGLWFGRFCPGWFLSIPPSVTIHLLQQKVKHHFKFHV